jgi:hypothetical protein
MKRVVLLLLGALVACAPPEDAVPIEPTAEPPPGAPAESQPLRQGFTQRPAPDTPGLPPSIPPFLSVEESEAARLSRHTLDGAEASQAQSQLALKVEGYEEDPSAASLDMLRETALESARAGRIVHVSVAELYADYLFPNSEMAADTRYKGQLAVFTGTVAPHNMRDFADGFKLVEQNAYVHDPLLLATDYELSFVECRLAQPSLQMLRDWQPIHFIAEVEGKSASDVMLRRCIVF